MRSARIKNPGVCTEDSPQSRPSSPPPPPPLPLLPPPPPPPPPPSSPPTVHAGPLNHGCLLRAKPGCVHKRKGKRYPDHHCDQALQLQLYYHHRRTARDRALPPLLLFLLLSSPLLSSPLLSPLLSPLASCLLLSLLSSSHQALYLALLVPFPSLRLYKLSFGCVRRGFVAQTAHLISSPLVSRSDPSLPPSPDGPGDVLMRSLLRPTG